MPKSLPSRPSLEQLRKQAKDLRQAQRSGNPAALQRIAEHHPTLTKASAPAIRDAKFALSDAQLVVAREHGFTSWPKLKEHVESILLETADPVELFKEACTGDSAAWLRLVLKRHPMLKAKINEPVGPFASPMITNVRSREVLDALIENGADLDAKSRWTGTGGGFGILHHAAPELALYAIQRGAVVDAHAAARLGLLDCLRELIAADPALVHARGGDGQTPLHFASTIPVAEFLLEHGADIDARDMDHESTPAQYMTRDRQEVARYLVRRGCKTDIILAAAIGDADLARDHLAADPSSIRVRISDEYFPLINKKTGGIIYQWTLGWYLSPHEVAKKHGHADVFRLLMEHSPAGVRLVEACWAGDETTVRSLLAENPGLVASLSSADRRQVAHAARNNNTSAVRVMLSIGLPVDALSQHRATPLHWAGFHGNVEMTREILRYNPPLELTDGDFDGTPFGWVLHGSVSNWHLQPADHPATLDLLLKAGAKPYKEIIVGTEAVKEVVRRHQRVL